MYALRSAENLNTILSSPLLHHRLLAAHLPVLPSSVADVPPPRDVQIALLLWLVRLRLGYDYLNILHYLHGQPAGALVMCDGNKRDKLLSQFLVSDDLHLILNDVDALPLANRAR